MTDSSDRFSQKKSYELLIFDWDGTLADSKLQIVSTMQSVIYEMNLPYRDEKAIGDLIGLGLADGLQRLYPDVGQTHLPELVEAYRRKASATASASPLFEGVMSTLNALRDAGYRLAIATGKSRRGLNHSLGVHQKLAELFETTRCADESAAKPDPLMLQQILEIANINAEQALMVGDTEYDVSMARSANVTVVGVCTGTHDEGRLRGAGASAVISGVSGLPAWLHSAFR